MPSTVNNLISRLEKMVTELETKVVEIDEQINPTSPAVARVTIADIESITYNELLYTKTADLTYRSPEDGIAGSNGGDRTFGHRYLYLMEDMTGTESQVYRFYWSSNYSQGNQKAIKWKIEEDEVIVYV